MLVTRSELINIRDPGAYLPGNHDHHMWQASREAQYSNHLERLAPSAPIEPPWDTTKVVMDLAGKGSSGKRRRNRHRAAPAPPSGTRLRNSHRVSPLRHPEPRPRRRLPSRPFHRAGLSLVTSQSTPSSECALQFEKVHSARHITYSDPAASGPPTKTENGGTNPVFSDLPAGCRIPHL